MLLSIAHLELNPMEMVWCEIKRKCASQNLKFKFPEVENIAKTEVAKVTSENFARYEHHVKPVDERYMDILNAE